MWALSINMMFISPYFPCTLPILSTIHAQTSWGVVFPLYVLGFTLIAALIFFVERFIVIKVRGAARGEAIADGNN